MNKKTKLLLSIVGVAAVLIPVVLLVTLSSKSSGVPEVSSEKRSIDAKNVGEAAKRSIPVQTPPVLPSPTPASGSAATAAPSPSPVESPSPPVESGTPGQ